MSYKYKHYDIQIYREHFSNGDSVVIDVIDNKSLKMYSNQYYETNTLNFKVGKFKNFYKICKTCFENASTANINKLTDITVTKKSLILNMYHTTGFLLELKFVEQYGYANPEIENSVVAIPEYKSIRVTTIPNEMTIYKLSKEVALCHDFMKKYEETIAIDKLTIQKLSEDVAICNESIKELKLLLIEKLK